MKYRNRYWSGKFRALLLLAAVITLQGCAEAVVIGGMGGLVAINDARTTKGWYQDQAIEKAALRALSKDRQLNKHGNISVTSFNGTVLMAGQVKTKALKKRAATLIAALEGVSRVHNEIVVTSTLNSSWGRDSYLTAKVKSKMFFNDFDGTRVKVVSDSGNVYLMGLLSRSESEQVVAMVSKVDGIRSVTKVFEYVD